MPDRHRTAEIGIIGGSGLYDLDALSDPVEQQLSTPYGQPSDAIVTGTLAGRKVAFLSRHGKGHRLSPSEIPALANIYAMKLLGVRRIVSVSAVGSLRLEYRPGEVVVPDQLVDRTAGRRPDTFFGGGMVVHVSFADPFCAELRTAVLDAGHRTGAVVHGAGTYCCVEGPQFSTRAESMLYRSWGLDLIGMTALPEAKLAREAGLCYATLALVTDYDCWHDQHAAVDARTVASVMRHNVAAAQQIVAAYAQAASAEQKCACRHALADAVLTAEPAIPPAVRERVGALLDGEPPG